MAVIPYFVLSPTAVLALISLLRGADKTNTTPDDYWKSAALDVIIPTRNEAFNIAMCLASLENQTWKVRKVTIIDDESEDKTVEYARDYLKNSSLNVEIIQREKRLGKTPSVYYGACSDADLIMVLDADTFLFTNTYIEKLVEQFQNPSVASASGYVYPLHEKDFKTFTQENPQLSAFYQRHPEASYLKNMSWFSRIAKGITNAYRDILYLYLESFIYKGQDAFCGTIPNTVGCAAIYRRDRLKTVFDQYMPTLGFNFTDAEDTFIGFSFIDNGYRNAIVSGALARTQEPLIHKLPKQLFIWSSGFLQTCYYFQHIIKSPINRLKLLSKKNKTPKEVLEKRKIQEPYRQQWGQDYSKKFGRPIGWFIFTSIFEKIAFPVFLAILFYLQDWYLFLYTFIAETLLISLVVFASSKGRHRLRNFVKTILITPLRYFLLLFDTYVVLYFLKDLTFGTKGKWRK